MHEHGWPAGEGQGPEPVALRARGRGGRHLVLAPLARSRRRPGRRRPCRATAERAPRRGPAGAGRARGLQRGRRVRCTLWPGGRLGGLGHRALAAAAVGARVARAPRGALRRGPRCLRRLRPRDASAERRVAGAGGSGCRRGRGRGAYAGRAWGAGPHRDRSGRCRRWAALVARRGCRRWHRVRRGRCRCRSGGSAYAGRGSRSK
mmetsp:Transcript_86087/g.278086  ORF Transcript_86087/g.278086 Transcript_86087/m.278086 type:complete len:205 (+) Transcript_86087:2377-2991(+)